MIPLKHKIIKMNRLLKIFKDIEKLDRHRLEKKKLWMILHIAHFDLLAWHIQAKKWMFTSSRKTKDNVQALRLMIV